MVYCNVWLYLFISPPHYEYHQQNKRRKTPEFICVVFWYYSLFILPFVWEYSPGKRGPSPVDAGNNANVSLKSRLLGHSPTHICIRKAWQAHNPLYVPYYIPCVKAAGVNITTSLLTAQSRRSSPRCPKRKLWSVLRATFYPKSEASDGSWWRGCCPPHPPTVLQGRLCDECMSRGDKAALFPCLESCQRLRSPLQSGGERPGWSPPTAGYMDETSGSSGAKGRACK